MTSEARYPKHFYETKRDSSSIFLGPYKRLDTTFYPYHTEPCTDPNRCEYYRDNVFRDKHGTEYIRDDTDYELLNCIVHPCAQGEDLVITPKRLAADPAGVITNYFNESQTLSNMDMEQALLRFRTKRKMHFQRVRRYSNRRPYQRESNFQDHLPYQV
jgi:hypothetical protein